LKFIPRSPLVRTKKTPFLLAWCASAFTLHRRAQSRCGMKILLHCHLPFALTHGGQQIQIEQTQLALKALGLEVEPLRWWDDRQSSDIIHFFGRMPAPQITSAQQKGGKVVMAELLTAMGSRSRGQLRVQKIMSRAAQKFLPSDFTAAFQWNSYRLVDACVALTQWEAQLMHDLFGAPSARVHVVPNGVEEIFFQSPRTERGDWLVCTATITQRKRVLELAEAAIQVQTPVWIVGKAYTNADPYVQRFFTLAKQHPKLIRYEGPIADRARLAQIYRAARGFVLLSAMESLSLSALEAAACECPLLLSDLPWAKSVFGERASYCPNTSPQRTAGILRKFYDEAPTLTLPPKPLTWIQVAEQLKAIYERVLSTSS
jgi:glycosyltransferase involved in cell wall biosynthesis